MTDTTFYTLADSDFFVGTVALLNSLRLTGNNGELVVLDCGLDDAQRRALAPHATLVPLPDGLAQRKTLLKPYVHEVARPGILVWVDSDVIVTRHLEEVAMYARSGKLCFHSVDDVNQRGRSFPQWTHEFGLASPLRRQTYVSAGFFALDAVRWRNLLERWSKICAAIPPERVFGPDMGDPLWAGDQDALNALLMSEVPANAVEELPAQEAVFPPDMHRVLVTNGDGLSALHEGAPVALLHYTWVPKPWTARAWGRIPNMRRDAYVRLLPRVLFAEDVSLRLEPALVPPWLRPGPAGRLALEGIVLGKWLRAAAAAVVRCLPAGLRETVMRWRDRIDPPERGRPRR
jgi:hypothetical protein